MDPTELRFQRGKAARAVPRILIPYGTSEGHTGKIAVFIADVIHDHGHSVDVVDVRRAPDPLPSSYDGVVVGASIHLGKHDRHVVKYVKTNLDVLESLPTAFFSVSLAAHGDPSEAGSYVQRFEDQTGWRPPRVALLGGALLYTHYGFVKRHMMKKIATESPGDLGTDLSRDYVYTEWDEVQRFAEEFLADVAAASAR